MKNKLQLILILVLSISLTACLSVKNQTQNHFMLHIKTPRAKITKSKTILKLANPMIESQFAGTSFVYRTTKSQYLIDFYNAFFIPPADMLEQLTQSYLSKAGLFKLVADSGNSMVDFNYILHMKVTAIYADYRISTQPKSVISIHYTLFKNVKNKLQLIKQFTLDARTKLADKSTQSLITSWNQGLQNVLRKLTTTLSNIVK